MHRLLQKLQLYFCGKRIWKAKMSEKLRIRIISEPEQKTRTRNSAMRY